MEPTNNWVYRNTEWFYNVIYKNPLFYIDYWSFVHLWLGAFLYLILVRTNVKHRWYKFILILLSYELVEFTIKYLAIHIFRPETLKDQLMDILIGITGGILIHYFMKGQSTVKNKNKLVLRIRIFISLITALTISYTWVGYYNYSKDVLTISKSGFNWLTLIMWAGILFGFINFYVFISKSGFRKVYSFIVPWILLYLCILSLELAASFWGGENLLIKKGDDFLLFKAFKFDIYISLFLIAVPFLNIILYQTLRNFYRKALSTFRNETYTEPIS